MDSGLRADKFQQQFSSLREQLQQVIVGHNNALNLVLTAFLSGGHILLEGVPGLGKTMLAQTFARMTGLEFRKIQFTPDLMPADITGTNIITEKDGNRTMTFQQGPVFANIVLADEINRATPKTQSALLEAMQEKEVTSGRETHSLPIPFMVIGTQNPIEMRGTYPLPEAQKDRFMFKINLSASNTNDMMEIFKRTLNSSGIAQPQTILSSEDINNMCKMVSEVVISDAARETAAQAVLLTGPDNPDCPDSVKRYVRLGAGVRGGQALLQGARVMALADGQANVSRETILSLVPACLRHRLILNFEAGADEISPDQILTDVVALLNKA